MIGILGFVSSVSTPRNANLVYVAPSQRTPTLSGPFRQSRPGTGCAVEFLGLLPGSSGPLHCAWVQRCPRSLSVENPRTAVGSCPVQANPWAVLGSSPASPPVKNSPVTLLGTMTEVHLPNARPPQEQTNAASRPLRRSSEPQATQSAYVRGTGLRPGPKARLLVVGTRRSPKETPYPFAVTPIKPLSQRYVRSTVYR